MRETSSKAGMRTAAALLLAAAAAGCGAGQVPPPAEPEGGAATTQDPGLARYLACKSRARAWLDALEVDPVELIAHGVKGKKKLAEILDGYAFLHETAAGDPAERARIMERVRELAAHTRRAEYHNLREAPERELIENSMSYLRVLRLLEDLGVETGEYRRELALALPRLDAHMVKRGPWQRAMFREYYRHFGLPLPPALEGAVETGSVLERRPASLSQQDAYRLTHQVFVACNYGRRRQPQGLSDQDLAYLRVALPAAAETCMETRNLDLLGEVVSCMRYLGWCETGVCRRAVDDLLRSQNDDGTWGDYERYRATYGPYLDQHAYLHTTVVCLSALGHVFERPWAEEERD